MKNKISVALLVLLLSLMIVLPALAYTISSITHSWDSGFSGGSVLTRRCLNANNHWLTSERLSPNAQRYGPWTYGSINGCVGHYPVVNWSYPSDEIWKVCVGAGDSAPSSPYDHPNNRCSKIWRTSSGIGQIEIFDIAGQIVDSSGIPLSDVTVTLGGGQTIATDSNGNYRFNNLDKGTYTITPSKTGYTFDPPSRTANGPQTPLNVPPDIESQNFTGNNLSSISGQVLDQGGNPLSDVLISDGIGHSATTDGSGNYTIAGLSAGTYALTPSRSGYTFSPASRSVSVPPNSTGQDFVATPIPTYSISGRVTNSSNVPLSGVTISVSGGSSTTTDSNGNYTVSGLVAGTYTLTPNKIGYVFTPSSRSLTISSNVANIDFNGNLDPVLTIAPTTIWADGTSTAVVTLSGIQPGQRVRLRSSRQNIDIFGSVEGIVGNDTQYITTIRSATKGTALITAINLSTGGNALPVSANINFVAVPPSPSPTPPPVPTPVVKPVISGVSSQYNANGVGGNYPIGAGIVNNQIRVNVNWRGKTPSYIEYRFSSGYSERHYIGGSESKKTFDFGKVLRAGCNTLTIQAVAADGTKSDTRTYSIGGWGMPDWLYTILASGLLVDGQEREINFTIQFPAKPEQSKKKDTWLPGKNTHLGPQSAGLFSASFSENTYELGAGIQFERSKSTPGRKPWYGRGILGFIGKNDLEVDFGGVTTGRLGTCGGIEPPNQIKVYAKGRITFEWSESVIVVINPIAPAGPAIVNGLKAIPPVYNWIKDRAKFYLAISPEIGGSATFQFHKPYLTKVATYVQGDVEGGIKIDIYAAEGKVFLYGGTKLEFGLYPSIALDKWTMNGGVGYEVKCGWFQYADKRGVSWTLYSRKQLMNTMPLISDDIMVDNAWRLIPRSLSPERFTFSANDRMLNAMDSVSINSTPIILNTFAYPETTMTLNDQGEAVVLWVNDDISRPIGQGYDLLFSRWDGLTWTEPASVTNDTYPDGKPTVASLPNGNVLAVWERLNDPALPVSATLDITTSQKIQLAWSMYSAETQNWEQPTWLTSQLGGSNRVPVLAQAEDGATWVAWRNNPNGAAWGSSESPEAIQTAKWSGNSWEATTTIASDIPGIVDLALAHGINDGVLAWTVAHPSATIVTPTLQVFFSRFNGTNWSQPERFTYDDSNHTKLQIVYRDGNPYLVWLADQQLTIADLSTKAVIGTSKNIRDELQIIAFRVIQDVDHNFIAVFTGQESQQIDLYLSYFDEVLGVWGEPRRLTNDKAEEKYPNVALTSTGDLFSIYSRTPITYQVVSEPLLDPTQQITYSIPIEGQPDIYALVHTLGHNLTVESLDIAMPASFESQNAILTATVRNTADLPIYTSTLDFVDNGVPFKSISLPVLAAGDSTMVTATYSITAESGIREIAVIVDPQNTIIETDETDNQKQISAFGPDLKLESIDIQFWGGSEAGLVAQISNVGNTTMLASSVSFYITDTVLGSQSLPTILPGENVDIVVPWNFANLPLGIYEIVGYVSPDIGYTELITNNNMAYVSLPVQPNILVDPFVQTTSLMDVQIGITATIYNASIFPVNDVTVGIYRRSTIDDGSLVYTTVISSLLPNTGTEITTFIGGPLGCGIHVVADPYRIITETTYTDNIVSVLSDNGTCADFWNSPITGIAPLAVVFTDTSTGENSNWQWDFGNGFTSTLQSPTQIFTQSGSYTVTYTVIGQDGIDSIQRPQAVQVFALAHASFSMSPSSGMSPLTISFTNHSTGDYSTISWDFGDNNGSTEDNPLHTFEQSGTYTITLKVDGFGGSSVASQVIRVLPWNRVYLPMVLRQ